MTTVVGIHGMGYEKSNRLRVKDTWEPALRDGLEIASGTVPDSLPFDVAFYGDVFASLTPEVDPAAKSGADADAALDAELESLAPDDLDFLQSAAEEAVEDWTGPSPAVGDGKASFRPLPPAVRPLFGTLTRRFDLMPALAFIRTFRQVRLYLEDPTVSAKVRDRVVDVIGDGCSVLIAHSLGTVVGLQVLLDRPDVRVDTLITMGSPLGMRLLASRLVGKSENELGVPGAPSQIGRWVNIYDPADPIAGAGGLGRLWPTVQDVRVDNGDQPHSSYKYLSAGATGRILAAAPLS